MVFYNPSYLFTITTNIKISRLISLFNYFVYSSTSLYKHSPPEYRNWVSVSIKQGGTTIPKPEEMAELNYQSSTCEYSHLIDSLKVRDMFDAVCHTVTMKEVREMMKAEKVRNFEKTLKGVRSKIDQLGARRLDYLNEKGTGTWLVATPNNMCGTVLSAVEFRDELHDRYGLNILNAPSHCDGCNTKFSTTHALGCKVGGIIHSLHDESRDS